MKVWRFASVADHQAPINDRRQVNGLWHTVPHGLLHGSLSSFRDVLSSGRYRNNLRGTLRSSKWNMTVKVLHLYFVPVSVTFTALNCPYVWSIFWMPCCWCYYWSVWCLGGVLLCVVDVLAAGQGESEDRTSLRGVAVNPWPRWLSLQGGGGWGGGKGHLGVRLVQGHMMAGRGGSEVSNLVFVCGAFLPPPPSPTVLPLRTEFERQDNVKGKWLILWAFKGDGGLPTKGRPGSSRSWWMPWHSHMFVYKVLLPCFDHHKWQFPSSEWHLNNVLSLCLITA